MCGLHKRSFHWSAELKWAIKKLKGKSLIAIILRLAWRAAIYHIWRERNGRLYGQNSEAPSQIVKRIQFDVRIRTVGLKNIVNDSVNRMLCNNWGLNFG